VVSLSLDVTNRSATPYIIEGSVKICGLREPAHARVAADAGADLLGFIFAPSRRQITAEVARDCTQTARESSSSSPLMVGVFVNASVREMNEVAEFAGLDLIQIHGNANQIDRSLLARPILTALHPSPEQTSSDIDEEIRKLSLESGAPLAYLIDGFRPGEFGGLGVRADWEVAHELATHWPIILAGGLNSENVGEAISTVSPRAVDVSSGVETEGRKDPAKIEAFVRAAKSGFSQLLEN
jgi:phosphoribosylanthranilate isomerase